MDFPRVKMRRGYNYAFWEIQISYQFNLWLIHAMDMQVHIQMDFSNFKVLKRDGVDFMHFGSFEFRESFQNEIFT